MGYGTIDVCVDVLADAVRLFPSTYRVVGSRESIASGTVRLVVESEDISQDAYPHMTCMVRDAGSTRTITMEPVQ
jgi:hypothetical protein